MAGTIWPALIAGNKARASDVEAKFDWLEQSVVPMNGGSKTTSVYDLGESGFRWSTLYIDTINLASSGIFYLDSGGDTYLQQPSGGSILFVAESLTRYKIVADASVTHHFTGHVTIQSSSALFLDGGVQTYIHQPSGGTIEFVGLDSSRYKIVSDASVTHQFTGHANIERGNKFFFDTGAGGVTYISEGSASALDFVAGGNNGLTIDNGLGVPVQIKTPAAIATAVKFYFDGGSASYIWQQTTSSLEVVVNNNTATTYDTNGSVEFPQATKMRAYATSVTTLVLGTNTSINFDAESFDTLGEFSSSTFKPLYNGYYYVEAHIDIRLTGGSATTAFLILRNGSITSRSLLEIQGGGKGHIIVSDLFHLSATSDSLTFVANHTEAAGNIIAESGSDKTYVTINRVL